MLDATFCSMSEQMSFAHRSLISGSISLSQWQNSSLMHGIICLFPTAASPTRLTALKVPDLICYKIGGTVFEIETSCGGSELLYDKMTRLIKAETVKTPGDKEMTERYNSGSNLFVGRSLQEE